MGKFSVKKPFTVLVAVIMVLMLGFVSISNMQTNLLPDVNTPYLMVVTVYPGASPERVESEVSDVMENALGTVAGVESITATSAENYSLLLMHFAEGTDMNSALVKVSNKVDQTTSSLPSSCLSPSIIEYSLNMNAFMTVAVSREGSDVYDLSDFVSDTLVPYVERKGGVSSVSANGLIEKMVQVQLSQEKVDAINERLLEVIDARLADARAQLDAAEAQIEAGRAEYNRQFKNFNKTVSNTVMQQYSGEVGNAVETVRKQAQALLDSVNQLIAVVQEPEIQQALIDVRDGLQRVMDKFNETGMKDIDSLIEIVAELREITDKLTTALQQLQERLNTETGTEGSTATDLVDDLQVQQSLSTVYNTLNDVIKAMDDVPGLMSTFSDALGTYSQQQLEAYMKFTEARETLNGYEKQLETAKQTYEDAKEKAMASSDVSKMLDIDTLAQLIYAQNFSMPAGYIQSAEGQNALKVGDKFTSLEELQNWVLFRYDVGDVGEIRLTDIATVRLADNAEELYAKINGNDGVLLTVQKSSIASTSGACDNLYAAMAQLEEKYEGLHLTALSDQGQYIDLVISSVLENLLFGALLAVIVLMLFLRDFRPTIIVALSIPISLLLAVVLMHFTGVTLNIISLSGLALGVGMLVDNSIVAIENIYRLRQLGYNAATAAVHGCRQIAGAITASTLTTVCVFVPILFTSGLTRQIFADMGLTIAYSLGASLLVALTLVPALSGKILTRDTAGEKPNRLLNRMIAGYENLLRKVLRHKAPVLLGAVALLIASAVLAVSMGTAFMPEMDSPQVSVSIEMPEDATQSETWAMCDTVLERILTVDGVDTVGAMEGQSMMSMGGSSLSIYVLLGDDRSDSSQEIAKKIEEACADLDCTVSANGSTMDMSMMTGGSGIQLAVTGDDMDALRAAATDLAKTLSAVEGVASVSDGQEDSSTEVRITVDKAKAAEYNLTVAQVYQQVAAAVLSQTTATNITVDNSDLPVVVVPDSAGITTRETLEELRLTGTKNQEECEVRLSEIAAVTEAASASAIHRENQARTVTVTAQIADGYNIGLVSREVEKLLADYEMPDGCSYAIEGENEMIQSTMSDLVLMIALAIAFIYLIMVAQFQSLLSPFIVLFTIPLAFTGGLLALWITGKELSVIAMLGFLMLAGVVVNNGIVFVDYANGLRLEGMERAEALVQTGRDRIRPILMTAMTTIFGLATMALGLGAGGDMLQPLAIVTIGGLAYATPLTLFIVPAIYDIFLKKDPKKVVIEEVEEA